MNVLLWEYTALQGKTLADNVPSKLKGNRVKNSFYFWILYLHNVNDFTKIASNIGFHPMLSRDSNEYIPLLKLIDNKLNNHESTDINIKNCLKNITTELQTKRGPLHNIVVNLHSATECTHESLWKAFLVLMMVRWQRRHQNLCRVEGTLPWEIGWLMPITSKPKQSDSSNEKPLTLKCFKIDDKHESKNPTSYRNLSLTDTYPISGIFKNDVITLRAHALLLFDFMPTDDDFTNTKSSLDQWKNENKGPLLTINQMIDPCGSTKPAASRTRQSKKRANPDTTSQLQSTSKKEKKEEATVGQQNTDEKKQAETINTSDSEAMTTDATKNIITPSPGDEKKSNDKKSNDFTPNEQDVQKLYKQIKWDIDDTDPTKPFSLPNKNSANTLITNLHSLKADIDKHFSEQKNVILKRDFYRQLFTIDDGRREHVIGDKYKNVMDYYDSKRKQLDSIVTWETVEQNHKNCLSRLYERGYDEEELKCFEHDVNGGIVEIAKQVKWEFDKVKVGEEYNDEDFDQYEHNDDYLVSKYVEVCDFYGKQINTLRKIQVATRYSQFNTKQKEQLNGYKTKIENEYREQNTSTPASLNSLVDTYNRHKRNIKYVEDQMNKKVKQMFRNGNNLREAFERKYSSLGGLKVDVIPGTNYGDYYKKTYKMDFNIASKERQPQLEPKWKDVVSFYDKQKQSLKQITFLNSLNIWSDASYIVLKARRKDLEEYNTSETANLHIANIDNNTIDTNKNTYLKEKFGQHWYAILQGTQSPSSPNDDSSDLYEYDTELKYPVRKYREEAKANEGLNIERSDKYKKAMKPIKLSTRIEESIHETAKGVIADYLSNLACVNTVLMNLHATLMHKVSLGQNVLHEYNQIDTLLRMDRTILRNYKKTFQLNKHSNVDLSTGYTGRYKVEHETKEQIKLDEPKETLKDKVSKHLTDKGFKQITTFSKFDALSAFGFGRGVAQWVDTKDLEGRILCFAHRDEDTRLEFPGWTRLRGPKYKEDTKSHPIFYCWTSLYNHVQDTLKKRLKQMLEGSPINSVEIDDDNDDTASEITEDCNDNSAVLTDDDSNDGEFLPPKDSKKRRASAPLKHDTVKRQLLASEKSKEE